MQNYFLDAWERYTPYTGETPETPKHLDRFESSDASEYVSSGDDSGEIDLLGETLNRAYVSPVSLVSVPQGMYEESDVQEPEEWEEGNI